MKQNLIITSKAELSGLIEDAVSKALESSTQNHNEPEKKFLSRSQSAKYLSCSIQLIDKMIRSGKLSKHKVGRKTLIPVKDLEAILSS